jgi:hypothetical protein
VLGVSVMRPLAVPSPGDILAPAPCHQFSCAASRTLAAAQEDIEDKDEYEDEDEDKINSDFIYISCR